MQLLGFFLFVIALSQGEWAYIFKKYQRPFTVLDLRESYFKEVDAYPNGCFVFINPFEAPPKSIHLKRQVVPEDIYALSTCEHVDVLIVGDFLSRFNQSQSLIHAFQKMAHVVVLENGVLENSGPFILENISLIHPVKSYVRYEIQCDYTSKSLRKIYEDGREIISPWSEGINLLTYIIFNGQIPSRNEILKALPLDPLHADCLPHNMIIQTSKIMLIDSFDPTIKSKISCYSQLSNIKKLLMLSIDKSPYAIFSLMKKIYGLGSEYRLKS